MEKQLLIADHLISDKIFLIRGLKVMLDEDLADLYGVSTRRLNEQVSRNADRFPSDFMFQLTETEFQNLKSQIATSSWGGRRKLPNVFTEHGVLMLSSVLNSKQAIQINIQIMRIFTKIREVLQDTTEIRLEIELIKSKINDQDKNMEIIFKYVDELSDRLPVAPDPSPRKRIGYKPDEN